MKKIFMMMVALVAAVSMSAQTYVAPKFTDNTYVTLRYGVTGLMKPSSFKYVGGTCGDKSNGFAHSLAQQTELQFGKYITPKFAVALDGVLSWDTFSSLHKMSDCTVPFVSVSALAKYRFVETNKFAFTAVTGPGWVHGFVKGDGDANGLMAKFQLEFAYKVTDRVAVEVVPELNYNLTRRGSSMQPYFDSRDAWYGLNVGVSYRLGHGFTKCPYTYTQSDVDALNTQINDLRAELAKKPTEVVKEVEKVVNKEVAVNTNQYVVFFDKASAVLTNDAKATLDKITVKNVSLVVGSASPEGTNAFNERLATDRATAVVTYLRTKGVTVTEAKGVGTQLNSRVAVVTVK